VPVIINSRSCSNAGWWAKHLKSAEKNERVEVIGFYGLTSETIPDAFRELRGMAQASDRCKNFFSQYNINPVESLTEEQWEQAHDLHRQNHGLDHLPYFRVRHIKDGRIHEHGIALRVDPATGKAVSDSLTAAKNERTSRELETRFGLERGHSVLTPNRDAPRPERRPKKWEQFRGAEGGIDPEAVSRALREIKQRCDSGQSFKAGIEAAGYVLAQGDRRTFVVIDPTGDDHSLGRRLGIKAGELRTFMQGVDLASLPGVEEGREMQRATEMERQAEATKDAPMAPLEQRKYGVGTEPRIENTPADGPQNGRQPAIEREAGEANIIRGRTAALMAEIDEQLSRLRGTHPMIRVPDTDQGKRRQMEERELEQRSVALEMIQPQREEAARFTNKMQADYDEAAARSEWEKEQGRKRQHQGELTDARSRYLDAVAQHYDIRRPYSSLANVAAAEGAMARREFDDLTREAGRQKDPDKREEILLRRDIMHAEYMALTSERLAGMSRVITGRAGGEQELKDREAAKEWMARANELKERRYELLEGRRDLTDAMGEAIVAHGLSHLDEKDAREAAKRQKAGPEPSPDPGYANAKGGTDRVDNIRGEARGAAEDTTTGQQGLDPTLLSPAAKSIPG
jgi:hypothetical protein